MKKIVVLIALALPLISMAQKTQDPDTLIWNEKKYAVEVDRYCPSVVSTYFLRRLTAPPFQFWSSTNNRGHVATMEIMDDNLWVSMIEAKRFKTRVGNLWAESGIDTSVAPDYFGMSSLDENRESFDGKIMADWFSGVLTLSLIPRDKKEQRSDEARRLKLLYIENGHIVESAVVGQTDSVKVMRLLKILKNLTTMYSTASVWSDQISFDGHPGVVERRPEGTTMLLERYANNPFEWKKDWSTLDTTEVNATGFWVLRNDSIFSEEGDKAFAYWLEGKYVIHYGEWVEDESGVGNYKVYKTQQLRVEKGVVKDSRFSPCSFEDDEKNVSDDSFSICNPNSIWSVDDKQLAEVVGQFKQPKQNPAYGGDKVGMRTYFHSKSLTDERAKDRLFRVRIGFMVNCEGKVGNWQLLNKSKGELYEFSNMVLDMVKAMPQNWKPALDKKGNPVDCWQILEFTVSNGSLTSANYK